MKAQFEKRLQELKTEFESGQQVLTELEAKQINLRETLLRISGAIQVIEEELAKIEEPDSPSVNGQAAELEPSLGVNGNSALSSVSMS